MTPHDHVQIVSTILIIGTIAILALFLYNLVPEYGRLFFPQKTGWRKWAWGLGAMGGVLVLLGGFLAIMFGVVAGWAIGVAHATDFAQARWLHWAPGDLLMLRMTLGIMGLVLIYGVPLYLLNRKTKSE